jgi:hypothetical protein
MKARDYDEINFDERQVQIRGKVYRHGFTLFMAILLLDAMLQGFGIVWADGFIKNILVIMIVVTVFCAELHFRGVMYGKKAEHKLFALGFGGISVFLLGMSLVAALRGNKIIEDDMLSEFGGGFLIALLILANALCALVQILRDKKTGNDS